MPDSERIMELMGPQIFQLTKQLLISKVTPDKAELYRERAEMQKELGEKEAQRYKELARRLQEEDRGRSRQRNQPQRKVVQEGQVEREDKSEGYTGETFTDEDQTDEEYCGECLLGHFSAALGMLEEADRLSQDEDKLNDEALKRVQVALAELKSSRYDIGNVDRDWTDRVKEEIRETRKKYLTPLLSSPSKKELIEEAKEKVQYLYDVAVEIAQEESGDMEEVMDERLEKEIGDARQQKLGEDADKSTYEPREDEEEELLDHLEMFRKSEDAEHLKMALELGEVIDCGSCEKRLEKAYEEAKKGNLREAKQNIVGLMMFVSMQ